MGALQNLQRLWSLLSMHPRIQRLGALPSRSSIPYYFTSDFHAAAVPRLQRLCRRVFFHELRQGSQCYQIKKSPSWFCCFVVFTFLLLTVGILYRNNYVFDAIRDRSDIGFVRNVRVDRYIVSSNGTRLCTRRARGRRCRRTLRPEKG